MRNTANTPTRRIFLGGACGAALLALPGCASDLIGPPPNPPRLYLLRPAMPPAQAGPAVSWQLAVAVPDAPASLDSVRIALTQSGATMDYFADAAWPDRLPLQVQVLLVEAFERTGRVPAVSRDSAALGADYLLQTGVRRFEADYALPDGIPTVVIRMEARLLNARDRRIAGSLSVEERAAASANSVPAVVAAFNTALGAALTRIVSWTLDTAPPLPRT